MLRETAAAILLDLTDAYDKKLSERAQSFYVKKFMDCEESSLRRAIDSVIDTREHFPRWAAVRDAYAGARAALLAEERKQASRDAEKPMTPAEYQENAELLAGEAVRCRAGGNVALAGVFEEAAEAYAARAAGAPGGLPVWKWLQQIVKVTGKRVVP